MRIAHVRCRSAADRAPHAGYAQKVRRGDTEDSGDSADSNAQNARFIKAAICAGFYPQVLRADNPPPKYANVAGGAIEVEGPSEHCKVYDRVKGRVFMHPSSVNFTAGKFESGWLVHTEMVETSKVFVRECSMVPVYAMLLFGGEVTVDHEKSALMVDGWARFQASAKVGVLVRELRARLSQLMEYKVRCPESDVTRDPVILAMHELLGSDGF